MYHWASKKSFSSVAEIFPKVPIIAWGFAFTCNPWLFSKGICSKLFSLHLTRSFELRKVYILLWIWRMRKSYQVECEHSVRFWFEYLRQRRNLRALAGICEFYPKLFLEVVIKRKSNSWDVRTFTIHCLKCHQVHTRSPQRKTMQDTVLGTAVWHEIFAGSNFCDFCGFSSDPQNMFLKIKITANIFPAKFFSRVNIL